MTKAGLRQRTVRYGEVRTARSENVSRTYGATKSVMIGKTQPSIITVSAQAPRNARQSRRLRMEADFILNLSACERLPRAVQPVANGCKLNPVTAEVRSNDRRLLPRCDGLFLPSYFAPSSHRNSICRPATLHLRIRPSRGARGSKRA